MQTLHVGFSPHSCRWHKVGVTVSCDRTSVVKQAQFKFPLWVVGHSTLAYLLPGRTRNLSPQRLERRIEVEVVAIIQKIPAQIGDLHAGWNGNGHDDGKRRRFGVLGG